MKYRRVLLKLSGEALMGEKQFGIDNQQLAIYAREVEALVKAGVECAIVIGGGNIFRGVQAAEVEWSGRRATTWACSPP